MSLKNGISTDGSREHESQSEAQSIPVIDLAHFTSSESRSERLKIAQDLVAACQSVGFVYIVNHGVSEQLLGEAFNFTQKLFDLSREEKMKAPHPPGWAHHRGYSWPGLEKVSAALSEEDNQTMVNELRKVDDCKESYEIGSESNPDQPNIWLPDSTISGFRSFMTSFYWTLFDTAGSNILRALALGIGLEEDHLLKLHSGNFNQLRLLHYPPLPAKAVIHGNVARMPAHTDWSTMTLLFQDDCGGLEVEDPILPGKFVPVPPLRGSLVMNVGDLLMRWSNDRLKSTSHRVGLPPLQDRFTGHERMTRARYSIPYFLTTDPNLVIECMPSCVDEEHLARYEPITQKEYGAMRARMQY